MEIQVSKEVYEQAKAGLLLVITAHLDPGADKALQEGARPEQVKLRARGTRKKPLTFAVIGTPDTVGKGYAVQNQRGKVIDTMHRLTARVVLGDLLTGFGLQSSDSRSDESPPE